MARHSANKDEKQVRLNFQLFSSDNALLVADLLNFNKGSLRHARLATLATIGLLTERRGVSGELIANDCRDRDTPAEPDPPPLTDEELESVQ